MRGKHALEERPLPIDPRPQIQCLLTVCTLPHNRSLFTVRYEPQKSLAMGMELRAEIEFRIREDDPDIVSQTSRGLLDVSDVHAGHGCVPLWTRPDMDHSTA
jgi:hypothetical protein